MRVLLLFVFLCTSLQATTYNRMAFTVGGATREQQVAFDASRFWQISDTKFFVGSGVRFTSQLSQGQTFRTAPASLTRGTSGPSAIFRPEKEENIDEMRFEHSQITSLNVLAQFLYRWREEWSVGFNIDVIGASFGKLRKGRYNPRKEDANWPQEASGRPTPFNLLLGDDNDRGSINSELYVHKNLIDGWGIKLGIVHAFTEYTMKQKLRKNNDRFRKKNYLPTIGLTRNF